MWARRGTQLRLQFDDSSLQPDHGRLRSVVGAQFGEDVLDSPLDSLLGDRELIGDLLVGVSGGDQAEHVDFCRRQGVIGRMLGSSLDLLSCGRWSPHSDWYVTSLNELNNANLRRNSYGALSDFLRLVSYSLGG